MPGGCQTHQSRHLGNGVQNPQKFAPQVLASNCGIFCCQIQQHLASIRFRVQVTIDEGVSDPIASRHSTLLTLTQIRRHRQPIPSCVSLVEFIKGHEQGLHRQVVDRHLGSGCAAAADQRISLASIDESRLLLLEEGHCLREQALQFCATAHSTIAAGKPDLGAASLSTIMQLIANGFGATLLPEMALHAEIGDSRALRALRFVDPEPNREIGLAWRRRSPRKHDFLALGEALKECRPGRRA